MNEKSIKKILEEGDEITANQGDEREFQPSSTLARFIMANLDVLREVPEVKQDFLKELEEALGASAEASEPSKQKRWSVKFSLHVSGWDDGEVYWPENPTGRTHASMTLTGSLYSAGENAEKLLESHNIIAGMICDVVHPIHVVVGPLDNPIAVSSFWPKE